MKTDRDLASVALEAFEALFNRRDLAAAEAFWHPDYIQHSAKVPAGRDGLFRLAAGFPVDARYESQLIVASGDHVIMHGRFSGLGDRNLVAADILRVGGDGRFIEHWDVLQEEATEAESASGLPMFGASFPG